MKIVSTDAEFSRFLSFPVKITLTRLMGGGKEREEVEFNQN